MKKLVIIDGKSVFYRGYYAMPGLSLSDGTPTGGVYGFASLALEVIRKIEPDYVVVAWDKSQTNIRRRLEIYPEYKANRKPAPADFYTQIPILHDLLATLGWPLYECDDYEADDIMATLAKQAEEQGTETIMITSDLDMLQVVDKNTKLYALKKGFSQIEEFDIAALEFKYGIRKNQFLDLKALKGDASDNIPGVPGIGEKTAIQLLTKYGDLNTIFAHISDERPAIAKKLEAGQDSAYMSKRLSELWLDAPVTFDPDSSSIANTDFAAVQKKLKELEFNSLIRRLPKQLSAQKSNQNPLQNSLFATNAEPDEAPPRDENEHIFDTTTNTLIAFDVKKLLHEQNQYSSKSLFDINQALFLLNPLRRDFAESGTIQEVYDRTKSELDADEKLAQIAYNFDFPLIPILYHMEHKGIRLDLDFLTEMSQSLATDLDQTEQQITSSAGKSFNINSPAQLSEILFTTLQLPTTGIKKTTRGYSTGQSELDKLRHLHPIIPLIEHHRELAKLKSTYVDALPKLADKNNRIHTTFTQNVTSTGRLSSLSPNLQNIPVRTELGRKIRRAFIADPGYTLVSADYSQFELRLAAVLADDKPLIEDFNRGIDIHTKTASDIYKIPIDQVTKEQRYAAKAINFGVLYGMSPRGLAVAANMDFYDAKRFIDEYFTLRAPIRTFLDQTLEQAKTLGYVETFYGRRRPTPDINSSNFIIRESAKRAAMNMPIQGTEADLMKRAMIHLDQKLSGLGEQILQVHDSILVECPEENASQVAKILKETMEAVSPELPIRLAVDVSIGKTWGDL